MSKIWLESGSFEEREREAFWKVWNSEEHVKKLVLKNSLNDFRLVFDSIDWSSINQDTIEPGRFKLSFLSQFRLVEQQVWSIKNLEKTIFWKTKHFNAETPQSTMIYEQNAWV